MTNRQGVCSSRPLFISPALLFLSFISLAYCRTYYDVLDLPATAPDEIIKKKYRHLAKKLHPDKNKNDPKSHEKFIELSKAYETLSDPHKRRQYDHSIRFGGNQDNEDRLTRQDIFNAFNERRHHGEEEHFVMFQTADGRVFTQRVSRSHMKAGIDPFSDSAFFHFPFGFNDPFNQPFQQRGAFGYDSEWSFTPPRDAGLWGTIRHYLVGIGLFLWVAFTMGSMLLISLFYSFPLLFFLMLMAVLIIIPEFCCFRSCGNKPSIKQGGARRGEHHLRPQDVRLVNAGTIRAARAHICVVIKTKRALNACLTLLHQYKKDPMVFCRVEDLLSTAALSDNPAEYDVVAVCKSGERWAGLRVGAALCKEAIDMWLLRILGGEVPWLPSDEDPLPLMLPDDR
jgi:DnaJ domain